MRAWFAIVYFATAAAVVVACDNGDQSTFAEQKPDGGGVDNSVPPGSLGGNGDAGNDAPTANCTPVAPASFTPTWSPPKVMAGACTTQEMADAYDSCFAPPVDSAKCTTYKTAHASCAACVSSDAMDGQHGPLVWQKGGLYFTANVAGCIALEQNDVTATSCGAAFDAAVDCKRAACDACVVGPNLNFSDLATCENSAGKTGQCATLGGAEGMKCGDLQGADASTSACFETSGEQLRDLYLRIAPLFCK